MWDKEKQYASQARWYRRNREAVMLLVKKNTEKKLKWLRDYKATLKCSRCPENHPACLDFHHRDPSEKEVMISHAILVRGWSIKRTLKEIEICDVLCANCHRKLHGSVDRDGEWRLSVKQLPNG